jgi:hypothetical protein
MLSALLLLLLLKFLIEIKKILHKIFTILVIYLLLTLKLLFNIYKDKKKINEF